MWERVFEWIRDRDEESGTVANIHLLQMAQRFTVLYKKKKKTHANACQPTPAAELIYI